MVSSNTTCTLVSPFLLLNSSPAHDTHFGPVLRLYLFQQFAPNSGSKGKQSPIRKPSLADHCMSSCRGAPGACCPSVKEKPGVIHAFQAYADV